MRKCSRLADATDRRHKCFVLFRKPFGMNSALKSAGENPHSAVHSATFEESGFLVIFGLNVVIFCKRSQQQARLDEAMLFNPPSHRTVGTLTNYLM